MAECIALKKPILGIKRRGCIEDEYIGIAKEEMGVGKAIHFDEWKEGIVDSFDYKKY